MAEVSARQAAASTALAVESKSVVLTDANFDEEVLHDTRSAFVLFFAPWCGHCKALHPHFERLCADLSDQDEFLAAVVDATEEVELAQSHGVTGACLPRLAIGARAHALTECFAATGRLPDHRLVRQARVLRPQRRSLHRRPLGGGNARLRQLQDRLGRCTRG